MLEACQNLRHATTNQEVLRRNDANIKEAERSLSYFENTLRELQDRKLQMQRDDRGGSSSSPSATSSPTLRSTPLGGRDRFAQQSGDFDAQGRAQHSPEAQTANLDSDRAPKVKNYTNLDLIKADTPHSTAKIARMLHQLEFKLQVEMQYKKGIEKMVKLYQADGDKKSRADAESKRVESEKKIQLLQAALKRYKNLHILDDADDDDEDGVCYFPLFFTPVRHGAFIS